MSIPPVSNANTTLHLRKSSQKSQREVEILVVFYIQSICQDTCSNLLTKIKPIICTRPSKTRISGAITDKLLLGLQFFLAHQRQSIWKAIIPVFGRYQNRCAGQSRNLPACLPIIIHFTSFSSQPVTQHHQTLMMLIS